MKKWGKDSQNTSGIESGGEQDVPQDGLLEVQRAKKHTRENMAPALNSVGILLTKYMEKTEILKATFASLSTSRICLQEY